MITSHLDEQIKPHATIQDVEAAVRSLDGAQRTLVLIELPSGQTLTIRGGPERFVAEVAESDTVRWATIDPTQGDESIDLVVGGQLADYPGRVCVTKQIVLDAVRAFVQQNGLRNPNLTWSIET
jgi:hypothetical protein